MTESGDTELLDALKQGDVTAFNTLFTKHWKKVYAVAYHRLGDEQDADDLVQELFISLWERRKDIIIKGGIENYLMGALKFKVISRVRSQAVKEKVFEEMKHRMTEIEQTDAEFIDYLQLEETLNEALQTLNENIRTAFVMRSDNLSIREIALQMGLKEQTVRNYIAQALQQIRLIIKQRHPGNQALYAVLSLSFVHHYLI